MTDSERDLLGRLPPELGRRVAALLGSHDAGEGWQPPPTRDAATVALIRDGDRGVEVFLQRRSLGLTFAAGMYVFPGGAVDPEDAAADIPWRSRPAAEPFARGVDIETRDSVEEPAASAPPDVSALIVAAVRETLEEAGVLLAVDQSGTTAAPEVVEQMRRRLDAGQPLARLLTEAGLAIDPARLIPWRHWMTPAVESRRFDARFFVAAAPEAHAAHSATDESDRAVWCRPAEALDQLRQGRAAMLPPTIDVLQMLADLRRVADAAASPPTRIRPFLPRPQLAADGSVEWVLADGYTGDVIDARGGPGRVGPA